MGYLAMFLALCLCVFAIYMNSNIRKIKNASNITGDDLKLAHTFSLVTAIVSFSIIVVVFFGMNIF